MVLLVRIGSSPMTDDRRMATIQTQHYQHLPVDSVVQNRCIRCALPRPIRQC